MSCFQCDLDIPHACYAGVRNSRWGLNDEAMAALEAARRYLNAPRGKTKGARATRTARPKRKASSAPASRAVRSRRKAAP